MGAMKKLFQRLNSKFKNRKERLKAKFSFSSFQVELFFLFAFIFLATIGLWLRPTLFGVDSYATLTAIQQHSFDLLENQPFANFVWGVLPNNLVIFKLIMFLALFSAFVPIWLAVKAIYGQRMAWFSTFLVFSLSPVLLFEFGNFENEIFAYPLIVWAIYFLWRNKYFEFLIFFALASLFWKWFFYLSFFNFGGSQVLEMQLFAGLFNFWALLPFVFLIPLLKDWRLRLGGLCAVFLWLFNAKFFIFLLPFVALSIPIGLDLLKKHDTLRLSLYILAFFGLFGWNIAFFMQQPTEIDLVFVSDSIKLAKDNNSSLFNDPSFGYWLTSQGYPTRYNPGSWLKPDYNKPGFYLTTQDLNCVLIRKQKEQLGRTKIKIFQC